MLSVVNGELSRGIKWLRIVRGVAEILFGLFFFGGGLAVLVEYHYYLTATLSTIFIILPLGAFMLVLGVLSLVMRRRPEILPDLLCAAFLILYGVAVVVVSIVQSVFSPFTWFSLWSFLSYSILLAFYAVPCVVMVLTTRSINRRLPHGEINRRTEVLPG